MKSNRIKTQLNYIKNLPSKKTDALTLLVVFLFFLEIGSEVQFWCRLRSKSSEVEFEWKAVSSARVLIDRPPFAMTMHLKPLYLYNRSIYIYNNNRKVHLEGVPVSWVLVDGGAAVNILPWSVLNRLGKNKDDLLPTDLCIINFTGGISKTMGVFPADMQFPVLSFRISILKGRRISGKEEWIRFP